MTTFSIREVPKAVVAKVLMDKYGIYIPASGFNDFSCRVSTHVYTMRSDVDRFLAGLRDISDNATKYRDSRRHRLRRRVTISARWTRAPLATSVPGRDNMRHPGIDVRL